MSLLLFLSLYVFLSFDRCLFQYLSLSFSVFSLPLSVSLFLFFSLFSSHSLSLTSISSVTPTASNLFYFSFLADVCTTPDVYRTFLKSKHDCIVPDKVTDLRACQWHNKACVFVDKTTTPAAATTLPTTTTTPGTTTTLTENKSCPPIRCPTPDNGCYWNREKATIVLNCPVDCGPLVCPATTTPATTTTTLATTTPQVSCVTDSNCPQDKFCLLRRGACVPYVYGDHQAVAPAGDIKWAECTSCRAACLKDDAKVCVGERWRMSTCECARVCEVR